MNSPYGKNAMEPKFKCQSCGAIIEAEPTTMMEVVLADAELEICCHREMPSSSVILFINDMDVDTMEDFGLTSDELEALERGEFVPVGGVCVCHDCQNSFAETG